MRTKIAQLNPCKRTVGNVRTEKRGVKVADRIRTGRSNLEYNALEPRHLLATFIVNTTADVVAEDGLVSLREAITAANLNEPFSDVGAGDVNGDTIFFDESIAGETIALNLGNLTILDDLGIYGGEAGMTIDAQSLSRVLVIASQETVVLRDLSLVNGLSQGEGGAILNIGMGDSSHTVLNGVTVSSSVSGDEFVFGGGGGVHTQVGKMTILNSTFVGNSAKLDGGGLSIAFNADVRIDNSTFSGNHAALGGGGIAISSGSLYLSNSLIGDSEFGAENSAGALGSDYAGFGGGLAVTGRAESVSVSISGSIVRHNRATAVGGGIFNHGSGPMVITDSTIVGNHAQGENQANPLDHLGGGGIFNNFGQLFLTNSTVRDNVADGPDGDGGGISSINGRVALNASTVAANIADRSGGGLAIFGGLLFSNESTIGGTGEFHGNVASVDGFPIGRGGGLFVAGPASGGDPDTAAYLNNTIVQRNAAIGEGGGIWQGDRTTVVISEQSSVSGNTVHGKGGGLFSFKGRTFVSDSTFAQNVAGTVVGTGAGLYAEHGLVSIDGSTISGNIAYQHGGGLSLHRGIYLVSNSVIGGEGPYGNVAGFGVAPLPSSGGGIHMGLDAHVFLSNTSVLSNSAKTQGGGIYNGRHNTLDLRNGSLVGNNNADDGGGIYSLPGAKVRLTDASVIGNVAQGENGSGGGINLFGSSLVALRTNISANEASRSGGGIEIIDSFVFMVDSMIGNETDGGNVASYQMSSNPGAGGGIHVTRDSKVTLDNTDVAFNFAATQGGGIWNQSDSFMTLRAGSQVTNNRSGRGGGGGIFNNGGTLGIRDSLVAHNETMGDGGGIKATADSTNRLLGSEVTMNASEHYGGGIYNAGLFYVNGSTVSSNRAVDGGGFFTLEIGSTVIVESVVVDNIPNDFNS